MRLEEAFELLHTLRERNPNLNYAVMCSGKRSLNVSPFYVAVK
jgi:hypothetical protein